MSYTLMVSLKKCVWSRSNIYWDGGKLTFVTDPNDLSKQGYQGVFFKWGSLVGISPAQTNGSDAYSSSTPVYIPIYVKAAPTSSSWVRNASHGYTDLPYLDASYSSAGTVTWGTDNRLAIDAAQNTDAMYESLRGDICQYLSKTGAVTGSYRLPTYNEIVPGTSWTTGGASSENNSLGNDEGTVDLLNTTNNRVWLKYAAMGDVVFPASGHRTFAGGQLYYVGYRGLYWSGSAMGSTNSFYMKVLLGNNPQGTGFDRPYGFSVRCVRN
jgi:hypothetical protein